MTSIDLDDDILILSMDPLDEDDDVRSLSDASTSDCPSTDTSLLPDFSSAESTRRKMSDIADLLDASVLNHHNDDDVDLELIAHSLVNNLRDYPLQHERTTNDHDRWQIEEHCLKFGSKQLSPSDYLTRKSLYNRPVAFEKDSRTWARSLLDNFQKPDPHCPSASSPLDFTYYFPMIKRSSSFDHHVQYIEHLNECNDYPAYLEYLRENRSQLFLTLTDSIDVIDGLIGTAVSSY